jgi:hypothetical protein
MNGFSLIYRFIGWKPTGNGYTACPLGDVLASTWVQGSWNLKLCTRLRFPFKSSASPRGRVTQGVFVFALKTAAAPATSKSADYPSHTKASNTLRDSNPMRL